MDFPAVTVCNQNRVHCGHLKQMIAANLSETRNLSIAEAYFLLEKGEYSEEDNFAEMFSLLEDTGCRNDFDKFNDTVLPEGSFSCIVCVDLYLFCTNMVNISVVWSIMVQIEIKAYLCTTLLMLSFQIL